VLAPRTALVAALSAAALTLPLAMPASAAEVSDPIAEGLIGPLDLSVGNDGSVFVAQAFAGLLTRHSRGGGEGQVVAAYEGGEIAGVDATRAAQTGYVRTAFGPKPAAALVRLNRISGRSTVLSDLQAYEQTRNPDAAVRYGFEGLPAGCEVDDWYGGSAGYPGIVEAHPYAVAAVPGGFVVADAAANALLKVTNGGTTSTLAVLPRHSQTISLEQVRALNAETAQMNAEAPPEEQAPLLPECVAGRTYHFEAVPTDVELGPDGALYVSTLAGGPESPTLGARSRVYRVDRRTGALTQIGTGFLAAVDLAVDRTGTVYVAELFAGRISKLVAGAPQPVVEVPLPGGLEWHPRTGLLATVDVFGEEGGSLVAVTP
jgi:hypothetical protein